MCAAPLCRIVTALLAVVRYHVLADVLFRAGAQGKVFGSHSFHPVGELVRFEAAGLRVVNLSENLFGGEEERKLE